MPQLDPSTFPTQLFWLVVSFVVLYLLMWRVALPRISDVLQERQERIDDDLQKAEQLRADAQQVLETYERSIADGRNRAQAIVREAAEKLAAETAERNAALGERIVKQTAEAETRIAAGRDAAIANVRGIAAEVAGEAVARLIDTRVTAADAEAAVGAVIGERR